MTSREANQEATRMVERLGATRRKPPSNAVVIELGGAYLRAVECARRGKKVVVTRIVTERLPADLISQRDPAATGRWIAKTLAPYKLPLNQAVIGIPRSHVFLKPISLPPPGDMHELASMVVFQAAKELPFAVEEAVIDYTVQSHFDIVPATEGDLAEEATGRVAKETIENRGSRSGEGTDGATETVRVQVLVAAVRRDVVDEYKAIAAAAHCKLRSLTLRSHGNVRAIELCEGRPSGSVALVHVRERELIIDVLDDGDLAFSRAINLPAAAAPDASADRNDAVVELASREILRSVRSYQALETRGTLTKVVVVGEEERATELVERVGSQLGIPTSQLDPAQPLGLKGEDAKKAQGSVAAIGLGIGFLDGRGLLFDFLHPKRVPPKVNWRRRARVGAIVLVVATLAGLFFVRSHFVGQLDQELNQVRSQLSSRKALRQFKRDEKSALEIERWIDGDYGWLDQIADLSRVLPDSDAVYVDNLGMSANGKILVSLRARSGELPDEVYQRFKKAGYHVSPPSVTPSRDAHGYGFKTTVELTARPNEKKRAKLAALTSPVRSSNAVKATNESVDPELAGKESPK